MSAPRFPHAAVRAYVLGHRASDRDHEPTDTDIAAMAAIVRAGLEAGRTGFLDITHVAPQGHTWRVHAGDVRGREGIESTGAARWSG